MSKYYRPMKIAAVFIIILVSVVFFYSQGNIGPISQKTGTSENQKDRLFRKMGVLPLPLNPGPVDFTLNDLDGKPVRLSKFRGKIVFLNFWTTWCPDCRIEMPSMQKLHTRLRNEDFVMLTINIQESAERVKAFFKNNGLTFTALLDSSREATRRIGIRSIPTTFILDKTGNISGTVIGSRKWDSKDSLALFKFLIGSTADATFKKL